MREILFRGKRADNNEWSIGHNILLATPDEGTKRTFICPKGEYIEDVQTKANRLILVLPQVEVIPETVGQYTGLTDKNDKKIFDGDIVKVRVTENTGYGTKKYESIYEIKYHEKYCYFYLAREKNNLLFDGNWSYFVSQFEVVGNIHDNPELFKGGE